GLTFTSATRVLSGTPEAGTALSAADYTLTATDVDGEEAKLTLSITIRAASAMPIRLNAQMRSINASTTNNTVMLTSEVDWEAAETEDWITAVTPDRGTGTDNPTVIVLTYQENATFEDRTGTITFTETTAGASPPFEVTLEITQAGGSLLTTTAYEITAEEDTDASVNFASSVAFGPGITHWWITAEDGSPASGIDGIMSVSANAGTRALARVTGFTINVEENPVTTDRNFSLRLQLGTGSGDAVASAAFTVTQKGQFVLLGKTVYSIGARGEIDMRIAFEELTFRSDITHWWVTAADGALVTDLVDIRSVSHDGTTGRRQTVSETAFIMIVENNTRIAAKNFALALQVGTDSDPAVASVPFSVTQAVRQADGMIPVSTLEQLNAVRYDLNTDGQEDDTGGLKDMREAQLAYAAVFPNVIYEKDRHTGYMLTKDLDFKDAGSYASGAVNTAWTTGSGWRQIGFFRKVNDKAPFKGTFDGAGHAIANLYMNKGNAFAKQDAGLFAYVQGGTIKDLGIKNVSVRAGSEVGGFAAWLDGGTISGCYVSQGTITGNTVGGLVGYKIKGTISECYVSGVTIGSGGFAGTTTGGGLVGRESSGTIRECYVSGGTVTATTRAGGLVGQLYVSNKQLSVVSDCYVMNTISKGASNTGSLIGTHGVSARGTGRTPVGLVITCYAGGRNYTKLLGTVSANSTVKHSFHQAAESNGQGRTLSQLQNPTGLTGIYKSWNKTFNELFLNSSGIVTEKSRTTIPWDFGSNSQYPALKGIDVNGDGEINAADLAAQR
ncbi:MAG: BACON domain-containing carbohydrate-binding protein, partial [Ekhidna sp.]|nr:BACON domain-containing carbohydrate-binding protein [Ekhidna sp.]